MGSRIIGSSAFENDMLKHWTCLAIHTDPDMISYRSDKKSSSEKKKRERVPVGIENDQSGIYFTWRQSQCMLHFLDGFTQQEVADKLGISLRTIERYTKDMCVKLHCRDKGHLINTVAKTPFRMNALSVGRAMQDSLS